MTIKTTTGRKARPGECVCRCKAYRFPHREGSKECAALAEEEANAGCGDCMGTGIGWGGPDSRCGSCGGSGMPRVSRSRYRDEPDDREPDWRLGY